MATQSCPPGELVVGVNAQNQVACSSPGVAAEAVLQNDCFVYFGSRDSCNGCTLAPEKWGRVSQHTCELGPGSDNTCQTHALGGRDVTLFGLNLDGNVNGDDNLYVGLKCLNPTN